MFDDLDRLRSNSHLQVLLTHYGRLGEERRDIWQDRLMQIDGVEPSGMAKLHGELIAFGWIEQNTGQVPEIKAGAVPGCYRVTLNGQRAIQQIQAPVTGEEADEVATLPMPPTLSRRKRLPSSAADKQATSIPA